MMPRWLRTPRKQGRWPLGAAYSNTREVFDDDCAPVPPWRRHKTEAKPTVAQLEQEKSVRDKLEHRVLREGGDLLEDAVRGPGLSKGGHMLALRTVLGQMALVRRAEVKVQTDAEKEAVERSLNDWVNQLQGRRPTAAEWALIYESAPGSVNKLSSLLLESKSKKVILTDEQAKDDLKMTAIQLDLPRYDKEKLVLNPRVARCRHRARCRAMLYTAVKGQIEVRAQKPLSQEVVERKTAKPKVSTETKHRQKEQYNANRRVMRDHWIGVRKSLIAHVEWRGRQKGSVEEEFVLWKDTCGDLLDYERFLIDVEEKGSSDAAASTLSKMENQMGETWLDRPMTELPRALFAKVEEVVARLVSSA